MSNGKWVLLLAGIILVAVAAESQQQGIATVPPPWAYGLESATGAPPPDRPDSDARGGVDNGTLRHLPGSQLAFTLTQLRNNFGPADWYPGDHPAMPDIVAHGHKPDVVACSFCHYPNGKGRPVNTNLAGLPYAYILHTLGDFKSGARGSADTRKSNTNQMIKFATMMTDDEKKDAARYFSSMKWTPWVRVIETDTIPKMNIANGIYLRAPGNETEHLGNRIVETPENVEATEVLRDDRSGFTAYVPPGSIKRGEKLVMTGDGGKTIACTTCHGADLMGMDPLPGLAGRSPSYLVRQLYDMQHGFRTGEWTAQMKPVVAKLSADDMLAIAAYLSSRDVASGSDVDSAAIRKVIDDFVDAFNRHDAHAWAMPFGEDGDFTNVSGLTRHGQKEVEERFKELFAGPLKDAHRTYTLRHLRLVKPDVAAVDAEWQLVGSRAADGSENPVRKGLFTWVMVKQDGRWMFADFHESELGGAK